ncbi:phosphatase PAP2 family protein [Corynebacterium poyangense]|uniref:Phosphatase PAP2 family protein n=1 Tax=Corynebacterium poyangense TaxID=2684405 RepID=A0A7H0SRQ5_9CORY|nr:phosphatase PAP2 family protein [Corynebacterium poyangense]MBZ8176663.1 phosphatase PAP2 family protein [Corynebacterium poyangense]QNQ91230.1 phosphatase PAP2 family protein [Corynebacterium poyangense]
MDQMVWHLFIASRDHVPHVLSTLIIGWTDLFRPALTTLYALLITIYLGFRRSSWVLFPALCLLTSAMICEVLKRVIDRPRPPSAYHLVSETSASFPSGHATAVCSLAMVATLLCVRWRRLIVTLAWVNALGIMLSRLYVGVHWCTDVIAGAVLGVVCTFALWVLWQKLHSRFKIAKKT